MKNQPKHIQDSRNKSKQKKQVDNSEQANSNSDSDEKSKVSKVTDISFGITKKVRPMKDPSIENFIKTRHKEAMAIKAGLITDYDFSKLPRDLRLYINHPRCGICSDFTNIVEPSQILFCSICETVVHERCLLTIDEKYYSSKIIKREKCFFKGRYTNQINFGGLFICEKCNEESNK